MDDRDLCAAVAKAMGWRWMKVKRPDGGGTGWTGFYWTPYLMRDGSSDVSRELDLPDFTNHDWQGTLTNFLAAHRIDYTLSYAHAAGGWMARLDGSLRGVVRVTGQSIGEVLCRLIVRLHEEKRLLTKKQRLANLYADIEARRKKRGLVP